MSGSGLQGGAPQVLRLRQAGAWGPRPSPPTRLWSPCMGGALSRLFCQMAFDSNIDVNGVWIMTLFVAGALLLFYPVHSV